MVQIPRYWAGNGHLEVILSPQIIQVRPDIPGSTFTDARGINNTGQIVGLIEDATGYHGFLATPVAIPEPAVWLLFGTGLAGLLGFR